MLLFIPAIGHNEQHGMILIACLGFYRTITEVFAYYFFAREAAIDQSHIGFLVASMNSVLVIAEVLGYTALGYIILSFFEAQYLFGFAGIACILGIATAWRIPTQSDETALPK
jgi:hypothetical protein